MLLRIGGTGDKIGESVKAVETPGTTATSNGQYNKQLIYLGLTTTRYHNFLLEAMGLYCLLHSQCPLTRCHTTRAVRWVLCRFSTNNVLHSHQKGHLGL